MPNDPESSNKNASKISSESKKKSFVGPKKLFGYPHATAAKKRKTRRQEGRCLIATDTPEKKAIEEMRREAMKRKAGESSQTEGQNKPKIAKKRKPKSAGEEKPKSQSDRKKNPR